MDQEELIKELAIVDENILNEAARQPLLFIEAVRNRVEAMRNRSAASMQLDRFLAKLALAIRAQKDEQGKKATEGVIKESIESHSKTKEFRQQFEEAMAEEEFAKGLIEAYRMRRDAIRVIAEAQNYEAAPEAGEVDRILRNKLAKQARQNLEELRFHKKSSDE